MEKNTNNHKHRKNFCITFFSIGSQHFTDEPQHLPCDTPPLHISYHKLTQYYSLSILQLTRKKN